MSLLHATATTRRALFRLCAGVGLLSAACLATPAMALADPLVLPSGGTVTAHDVIWGEPGPAGLTVRFRFLDPSLAARVDAADFDGMEADTAYLCETYAIERISDMGPAPNQIIISIADRELPFGEPAPEAAQIFEAYGFDGTRCTWEGW